MTAKLLAEVLLLAGLAFQAAPPGAGVIVISLLNRPVGVERFDLRSTPQGFELTANMDVTERGAKLQLASTLVTTTDFTPTRFISKGKSYRFVNVDTDVNLGVKAEVPLPDQYFAASGYGPLAGRAVLIRYWEAHKRPAHLTLLPRSPGHDAAIEYRGIDTVRVAGRRSVTNNTDAATAQRRVRDGQRMVKALFDAGVPIVAGTDGGLPGHSLLRSLELYVGAGLTPMQALLSATQVPDVRRVRWVATNGRLLSPSGLWPLAGFRASGTMP